jgi:hypothetical protein
MRLHIVGAGFPRTGTSSLQVRRVCPPHRLVEWKPEDGWAPICEALGVDMPAEPFPHVNKTEDWERGHEGAVEDAAVS